MWPLKSLLTFAPDKSRIVIIAALAALFVACLLALLLDRLSNTLNSTADVEDVVWDAKGHGTSQ